jgi:hypothetical protein
MNMPRQTFLRLLEEEQEVSAVFGPEELALLTRVFDQVLVDLKLVKRDDPIVTMVAKVIIELVRRGERDSERLRKEVLGRRYQPQT